MKLNLVMFKPWFCKTLFHNRSFVFNFGFKKQFVILTFGLQTKAMESHLAGLPL